VGCGFILLFLITGKKILSAFLGILIYVLTISLNGNIKRGELDESWYLLSYFHLPKIAISDINPYFNTPQIVDYVTFFCFWLFLLYGLFIFLLPLFSRNNENLKTRIRNYKQESNGLISFSIPLLLIILSLTCSYFIISKNKIEKDELNFRTKNHLDYIEKYRKYSYSMQPEIVMAEFNIDIYPELNKLQVKGNYNLKNVDSLNIDTLFLTVPLRESAHIKVKNISLNMPNKVLISDTSCHFFAFLLGNSLCPNDSLSIFYELEIEQIDKPGYRDMHINDKWSIIESRYFVITTGYGFYRETNGGRNVIPETDKKIEFFSVRRNLSGNRVNPIFQYTVSCPNNQILIGDGNFEDEFKTIDRKTMRYNSFKGMDIFNFSIITSTLYEKVTSNINNINVAVYFSSMHKNGAQGILESANKMIINYSEEFGNLPFHSINIVEAPNYRGGGGVHFQTPWFSMKIYLHMILETQIILIRQFTFFLMN
jgi:hypothetical protein